MISLLITLGSKKNDKRGGSANNLGEWKYGLERFDKDIQPIIDNILGLILNFEVIADIITN